MTAVGSDSEAGGKAVTLFAVAQALGRLSSGVLADVVKTKLRLPSSAVLVGSTVLMTAAHALMASVSNGAEQGSGSGEAVIFAGVVVAGLGFGVVWPLIVVLAGDFFGLENLGANYSFYDGLSSAFGALCFGLLLPSAIYKQHATYEDDRDDSPGSDGAHHEETCTVPACFQAAYSVVALVNGLAVLCAVALTRSAYRRRGGGRSYYQRVVREGGRRLDTAFQSAAATHEQQQQQSPRGGGGSIGGGYHPPPGGSGSSISSPGDSGVGVSPSLTSNASMTPRFALLERESEHFEDDDEDNPRRQFQKESSGANDDDDDASRMSI